MSDHDFGFTIHGIGSAVDHLKKLASQDPEGARRHSEWLARLSDELSELSAALRMKEAAE